ncbi:efflux RND transporter periplasmic adaptor subunit [bacterium]|nr:efflux RND transporter periplasmic adaptor subunit [bacterium]
MLLDFNSFYDEIDEAAKQTTLTLEEFENHLYYMQLMLEATITSADFSQTNLDAFISTINLNRVSVNTKVSFLNTKIEAIDDAKENLIDDKITAERNLKNSEATLESKELSLEQAKRDYDNLISPLTEAEKALARSRLTSASVSLERAQNELDNATIISPIDGEVARLNYKTGDIILDNSASDPVAVILNNDTLFIEVYIEEADINKIKIGQSAYVSFDALDDLEINGEVNFISLTSKTDNNGIVTYLVRIIIIDKGNIQIREGMTAFVDFVTAEVKDVLIIPVKAVRNINDVPSVLNDVGEWLPVITGFTDGKSVEVIQGINIGDKIIY